MGFHPGADDEICSNARRNIFSRFGSDLLIQAVTSLPAGVSDPAYQRLAAGNRMPPNFLTACRNCDPTRLLSSRLVSRP